MRTASGETLRPGGSDLTARVLALAAPSPAAVVLDVGCGLGATVGFLAQRGFTAVGVEPDERLLREARARRPELDLRSGRAEALPLPDSSVDGVFLECVLSVTEDPALALREAWRVLRPQGFLALSDLFYADEHPAVADRIQQAAGQGCLRALGTAEELRVLIESSAFKVCVWEDHSAQLRSLAARIVFEHGSLEEFLDLIGLRTADGRRAGAAHLGYFLAVGRKADVHKRSESADEDETPGGRPAARPRHAGGAR